MMSPKPQMDVRLVSWVFFFCPYFKKGKELAGVLMLNLLMFGGCYRNANKHSVTNQTLLCFEAYKLMKYQQMERWVKKTIVQPEFRLPIFLLLSPCQVFRSVSMTEEQAENLREAQT